MRVLHLLAAAIAGSLMAGAAAAQEFKARLGTSLPDSHPQTLGARKFADLAETKTAGRVKIQVFSNRHARQRRRR